QPDLSGADETAGSRDTCHAPALAPNARHFAVLDDVAAAIIRSAGQAPGDGIMARRPAARLQQAAVDGETGVIGVEVGNHVPNSVTIEQNRVDAVQPHRIPTATEGVHLWVGV